MAKTTTWRRKRCEFVGVIMAVSLSSAIEILDAGVGQVSGSLFEGSSVHLKPEWE
jgi:hypothetical protein